MTFIEQLFWLFLCLQKIEKKFYLTLGTSNKETIKNYHTSVYDNCRYSDLEKISLTIDPNPSEG